jgi:hypothetical protein
MKLKNDELVGVRVRIASDHPGLDHGNRVGTIMVVDSTIAWPNAFVAIDKPGVDWNRAHVQAYGRGWWYALQELEPLVEEP